MALALVINLDIAAAGAATLYDASQGKLPHEAPWNWSYGEDGSGAVVRDFVSGAFRLDTTAWTDEAGYNYGGIFTPPAVLDSDQGFSLDFGVQVMSENHSSSNRSGFSLIVLDSAAKGVELSFWTDEVFAKNADAAFSHNASGESAAVDTTIGRTYSVSFSGSQYRLLTDGSETFSGALRNYQTATTPFSLAWFVYGQANYVFFGDNTSSAYADVRLDSIALVPEPAEWALMLAGLGCISAAIRRRRAR